MPVHGNWNHIVDAAVAYAGDLRRVPLTLFVVHYSSISTLYLCGIKRSDLLTCTELTAPTMAGLLMAAFPGHNRGAAEEAKRPRGARFIVTKPTPHFIEDLGSFAFEEYAAEGYIGRVREED